THRAYKEHGPCKIDLSSDVHQSFKPAFSSLAPGDWPANRQKSPTFYYRFAGIASETRYASTMISFWIYLTLSRGQSSRERGWHVTCGPDVRRRHLGATAAFG